MIDLTIDKNLQELYDLEITKEFSIKFKKLEEIKSNEKISLLSDSMFKTLFCNSHRLKYSAKFLSYYINVSYEEILKNIKLNKTELDKDNYLSKGERCDYVALLQDTLLNIEVNCNSDKKILERNIDYAFRHYKSKIVSGTDYKYTKIIQFNLNNFSFKGKENIIDVYRFRNNELLNLTNDIVIVQIYVPNIRRKCFNKGIDSLDESERFVLSLIETNIDEANKLTKGDEFMSELVNEQVIYTMSPDLRNSYDRDDSLRDEGRQEGLEEGQRLTNINNVISLYKNGVSKEIIVKSLNVSDKEFEEIINEKDLRKNP